MLINTPNYDWSVEIPDELIPKECVGRLLYYNAPRVVLEIFRDICLSRYPCEFFDKKQLVDKISEVMFSRCELQIGLDDLISLAMFSTGISHQYLRHLCCYNMVAKYKLVDLLGKFREKLGINVSLEGVEMPEYVHKEDKIPFVSKVLCDSLIGLYHSAINFYNYIELDKDRFRLGFLEFHSGKGESFLACDGLVANPRFGIEWFSRVYLRRLMDVCNKRNDEKEEDKGELYKCMESFDDIITSILIYKYDERELYWKAILDSGIRLDQFDFVEQFILDYPLSVKFQRKSLRDKYNKLMSISYYCRKVYPNPLFPMEWVKSVLANRLDAQSSWFFENDDGHWEGEDGGMELENCYYYDLAFDNPCEKLPLSEFRGKYMLSFRLVLEGNKVIILPDDRNDRYSMKHLADIIGLIGEWSIACLGHELSQEVLLFMMCISNNDDVGSYYFDLQCILGLRELFEMYLKRHNEFVGMLGQKIEKQKINKEDDGQPGREASKT